MPSLSPQSPSPGGMLERFTIEKGETRGGTQRRPARSERRNRVFPRNDRLCGVKRAAFQEGKQLS